MYGEINSGWELKDNGLSIHVAIPANTTARVYVPASSETKIKENGMALSNAQGIKVVESKDGYVQLEVGSGNYNFVIEK